jgi:hypothetical protein
VVASFAIGGDTVRATCPACRHVMSVAGASPVEGDGSSAGQAAPASAAPAGGPANEPKAAPSCPKCGAARRGDALACGSCGLTVARMAAYVDARDAAVPEPVREAWARATAAWSDEARHDEVLRQVASHNAYAWAAGRYRTRDGDPVARRQLDRLRRAAEATLLASATARPAAGSKPYRGTAGVLAVLIVVIVVGLLYAVVLRDHPATTARSPGRAGAVPPLVPGHPVSSSTIK